MSIFSSAAIQARRKRVEEQLGLGDHFLVIHAGEERGIPGGMDQHYGFVPHPDYYWLTGMRRPGGTLVYHPQEGWRSFVHPVTESERVWSGVTVEPEGEPVEGLPAFLATLSGSKVVLGGAESSPVRPFEAELWHLRRPKDGEELALMRLAAQATRTGHQRALTAMHPGSSERDIAAEIEYGFALGGATGLGYGTIVGFGSNAAVLHFAPSSRQLGAGEMVLVDAGAQVHGYVIDVTRTYLAQSPEQKELYAIVLEALRQASAMCLAGVEWLDVHAKACHVLADGLHQMGVLKCNADVACESEAIATFMPHGVGHAVGLGVRDCSGPLPGREAGRSCGSNVRCNFPLAPGYVMTVEPGIYFIDALLQNSARRERFATEIDFDRAMALLSLGGVRLEDNLLVTEGTPENLTISIPI